LSVAGLGYGAYKVNKYEPEKPGEVPTAFCYSTIAAVECYPVPQESEQNRLVAYDGTALQPKPEPEDPDLVELIKESLRN